MSLSILLIGAGQLGSRYLQGLAALKEPSAITVVDPSEASLAIARERLEQVPKASAHAVQFETSLENTPQLLDLVMVVTPAHCRANVTIEVARCCQAKAWILEKVLSQNNEQLDQIGLALANNGQTWVNTPRRLMVWHKSIRSRLMSTGRGALHVRVSGGSWGMACNAIHFIDLVAWWSGATVKSVDTEGLGRWVQSKRVGFQEVFGILQVAYTDGSQLELYCHSGDEPTQITVATPHGDWLIEESSGKVTGSGGQDLRGRLNFQSELTAPLVEQILQEGSCDLPTLVESMAQHRPFLNALMKHWNKSQGCHDFVVPIT